MKLLRSVSMRIMALFLAVFIMAGCMPAYAAGIQDDTVKKDYVSEDAGHDADCIRDYSDGTGNIEICRYGSSEWAAYGLDHENGQCYHLRDVGSVEQDQVLPEPEPSEEPEKSVPVLQNKPMVNYFTGFENPDAGISTVNTYQQITIDYVVNGILFRTDVLDSGRYIQIRNRVPYVADLITGTEYEDYDWGEVTRIECRPLQYFPGSAHTLREGQSIDHSGNYKKHTIYYTTSRWSPHVEITPPTPGGGPDGVPDGEENIGSGSKSWTQRVIYHANYPDGSDPQVVVTYHIKHFVTTYNHFNIKKYAACGFECPDGYTVNTWYTAKTGGSHNGSSIAFQQGKGDIHLWARYTPNGPEPTYGYVLNWDYNDGTTAVTQDTALNQTGASNATHTFPASKPDPTRLGYVFTGWQYDKAGYTGSQVTMQGVEGSVVSGTMTAQWSPQPGYKFILKYDANGGENPPESQEIAPDGDAVISDKQNMSYPGHVFLGWSRDPGASEPDIYPDDVILMDCDLTLYAIWEEQAFTGVGELPSTGGIGSGMILAAGLAGLCLGACMMLFMSRRREL